MVTSYVILYSMIFAMGFLSGCRVKKQWLRDKDLERLSKRIEGTNDAKA